MGMDRLLESLREDARERGEEILSRAREEAERVRAEGRDELRALRERRLEDVEAEARAAASGEVAAARREAAAARLRARDRVLERVFEGVRVQLSDAVGTEDYRRLARVDLGRTQSYVGGREGSLRCGPETVAVLEEAMADLGLEMAVDVDREAAPGFRAVAEGGSPEVDATLPTWLERLRPELAIELAGKLLG